MSALSVLACCAVLEQFAASLGGAAIESFSYRSLSVVKTPTGEFTALAQVYFLAPDRYREDASMSFGKIVTVRRGDESWASTPRGVQALTPDQHARTVEMLYRSYLGLAWAIQTGRAEAEAVDDVTVSLTLDGHQILATFDPETSRLVELRTNGVGIDGAPVTERRVFSEFDFESQLPARVEVFHDDVSAATITIKRWQINDPPEPSFFDEPAPVLVQGERR